MSAARTIPGPWEISGGAIWGVSPWNARVRIAQVTHFSPMNGIDSDGHERQIAAVPELLAACQSQLQAIDALMARLIELDPTFMPSKSEAWAALVQGSEAIAKATGTTA